MGKTDQFKKFAGERGIEVDGRTACFGENGEAARKFAIEARSAGFNVYNGCGQAAWVDKSDSGRPQKLDKWYVTLRSQ